MTGPEPAAAARGKGRWRRWLLELGLVLAVFLAVQLWQTRDVPRGVAPDFSRVTVQGQPLNLGQWRAAQGGGPVVLYFWADWCPICKTLEGMVDTLGLEWPVLSIAMQSGDAAQVARSLAARGLAWTTVADADGALAGAYGLKGVPALVVIDARGQIRFVSVGLTSGWGMALRLWWASHFHGPEVPGPAPSK